VPPKDLVKVRLKPTQTSPFCVLVWILQPILSHSLAPKPNLMLWPLQFQIPAQKFGQKSGSTLSCLNKITLKRPLLRTPLPLPSLSRPPSKRPKLSQNRPQTQGLPREPACQRNRKPQRTPMRSCAPLFSIQSQRRRR
jgi:hypothetical protein